MLRDKHLFLDTTLQSERMGSLYPILFEQESQNGEWTKEENQKFENALAIYSEKSPDRWLKVAALIPGRTVWEVMKKYKELEEDVFNIEAGGVPNPSRQTVESVNARSLDGFRKKPMGSRGRGDESERKKGILKGKEK